ncbi:MAG: MFS transporter [Planctomycetota bacterium]
MNKGRLFLLSCLALLSTSICFAVVGDIMGALKTQFVLNNEQVGYIGGASLWGFTVSIFALGPLVDALGMKNLLRFAFLCHFAGPLIMILAVLTGGTAAFWTLFLGALVVSIANGTVEAVCNPLIATLYAEEKTRKLNQFHVWFPGGILIGGVTCFLLNKYEIGNWQLKLALIFVPTVVYGLLLLGQRFPATERVESGISFAGMVRGALGRPLFLILLACMAITASLELGPGRWVPAVLTAGGIAGILVLAYINGLMAVLRSVAGPVVHRLSPTGILVCSAILAGAGLYWFSFSETTAMAFASATLFAVGICYFWPTMLGVVSERVPKSGALGLALMGGMGMLVVGLVTTPQMGRVADRYLHEHLHATATRSALQQVVDVYPGAAVSLPAAHRKDVEAAVRAANDVLAAGTLPLGDTALALRSALSSTPPGEPATAAKGAVEAVLNPADNYGGRMSFRYVAPFSLVIILVFGILYLRDRAAGGYKAEKITA